MTRRQMVARCQDRCNTGDYGTIAVIYWTDMKHIDWLTMAQLEQHSIQEYKRDGVLKVLTIVRREAC